MTEDEQQTGGTGFGAAFTDIHYHFVPPEIRRLVEQRAAGDPDTRIFKVLLDAFPDLARPSADRELTPASGRAVISLPTALGPGVTGLGDSADLVRICNDEMLAAVAAEDAYESTMIVLPWDDPRAAGAEIERVGADPAVSGVILHVGLQQTRLVDEPDLEPVYRAIAEHGLTLFLHPVQEPAPHGMEQWFLFNAIASPTATSVAAARLMLSGMLDRVPDLTLIVPHLGGTLPYLAQRLADQSRTGDAEHDVPYYLRTRTYLDTCSFHLPALDCALATVGADRLVLGSDFPFRGPVRRAVEDVESELGVDGAERVLNGNLARLQDATHAAR
jgi:predicted TIM-barrel fold metal-dependent hydrolase